MAEYRLLVAFVAGISLTSPAGAVMYKWVDDKGTTHYSETIPPEHANKDRVELDKSGRIIGEEQVPTPERRRAQKEQEATRHAEEEAELERRRHDHALLNTYSSVKEIDLARERNLQQVQAHIDSITSQIENYSEKLQALKKENNATMAAGQKRPPSLKSEMQHINEHLTQLQEELEKAKRKKTAVEERFNTDKARYQELTGRQ